MEIDLPEDQAIALLGLYPKVAPPCYSSTCSTMFIVALFVIARSWNKSRCPPAKEWIQKMWFMYRVEYYRTIKNEDIQSFAGKWIEIENTIRSKLTQTQKTMHGMYSVISGWKPKNVQNT